MSKGFFQGNPQIGNIVEPFSFMTTVQVVRCKIIVSECMSASFKGHGSNKPGNEMGSRVI